VGVPYNGNVLYNADMTAGVIGDKASAAVPTNPQVAGVRFIARLRESVACAKLASRGRARGSGKICVCAAKHLHALGGRLF